MRSPFYFIISFFLLCFNLTAQDGQVWESLYQGVAGYDIIHHRLENILHSTDPGLEFEKFCGNNNDSLRFSIKTVDTLMNFRLISLTDSTSKTVNGFRNSIWVIGFELNEDKTISPIYVPIHTTNDLVQFVNTLIYPQISVYNLSDLVHFFMSYLFRQETIVLYSKTTAKEFDFLTKLMDPSTLCGEAEDAALFPATYARLVKTFYSSHSVYKQVIFNFEWNRLSVTEKTITYEFY